MSNSPLPFIGTWRASEKVFLKIFSNYELLTIFVWWLLSRNSFSSPPPPPPPPSPSYPPTCIFCLFNSFVIFSWSVGLLLDLSGVCSSLIGYLCLTLLISTSLTCSYGLVEQILFIWPICLHKLLCMTHIFKKCCITSPWGIVVWVLWMTSYFIFILFPLSKILRSFSKLF